MRQGQDLGAQVRAKLVRHLSHKGAIWLLLFPFPNRPDIYHQQQVGIAHADPKVICLGIPEA